MPMFNIKVLSTHAVAEVLAELAPAFERESGHSLSFSYNPTAAIKREINGGAAFDVAIITRPAVDELAVEGAILREKEAGHIPEIVEPVMALCREYDRAVVPLVR